MNQLASFTYVPPFRGRAIRMIRRDVPFDELEIDFAELEARKAAEYEKLNRVIRFALSGACRQQEILRYFGEADAARLRPLRQLPPERPPKGSLGRGEADGSRGGGRRPTRPWSRRCGSSSAASPAPRPASLAARTSSPRCSAARAPAKMTKLRLNQLSTFGLLAHLKQTEVVTLIEALIAAGYLQQFDLDRFRPVVRIDGTGRRR